MPKQHSLSMCIPRSLCLDVLKIEFNCIAFNWKTKQNPKTNTNFKNPTLKPWSSLVKELHVETDGCMFLTTPFATVVSKGQNAK